MKSSRLVPLLLLGLLALASSAQAQVRWRDLPPEERQQMRQQMRDHWQQERESRPDFDAQRDAPRWRDLAPEDRQQMRQQMRDQGGWENRQERAGPGGGHGGGPGPGRGWR